MPTQLTIRAALPAAVCRAIRRSRWATPGSVDTFHVRTLAEAQAQNIWGRRAPATVQRATPLENSLLHFHQSRSLGERLDLSLHSFRELIPPFSKDGSDLGSHRRSSDYADNSRPASGVCVVPAYRLGLDRMKPLFVLGALSAAAAPRLLGPHAKVGRGGDMRRGLGLRSAPFQPRTPSRGGRQFDCPTQIVHL